ncbi:hypothetical protein AFNJKBDN_CDS0036 [Halorubrum virus V_ICIS4]|nr:hypothetical protein AFNJKBDN_CDS0036 [Halorubrum virus V_ICIS4]
MTLSRTEQARQRLTTAITLAADGHATVAREQVRHVETTLRSRYVGKPALARRLEDVLVGEVTTRAARAELCAVARQLDAELAPVSGGLARARAPAGGRTGRRGDDPRRARRTVRRRAPARRRTRAGVGWVPGRERWG